MSGYEMWAWLVCEADGIEGVIAGTIPELAHYGFVSFHARERDTAERFREAAELHGRASGRPIRLAHLVEAAE